MYILRSTFIESTHHKIGPLRRTQSDSELFKSQSCTNDECLFKLNHQTLEERILDITGLMFGDLEDDSEAEDPIPKDARTVTFCDQVTFYDQEMPTTTKKKEICKTLYAHHTVVYYMLKKIHLDN